MLIPQKFFYCWELTSFLNPDSATSLWAMTNLHAWELMTSRGHHAPNIPHREMNCLEGTLYPLWFPFLSVLTDLSSCDWHVMSPCTKSVNIFCITFHRYLFTCFCVLCIFFNKSHAIYSNNWFPHQQHFPDASHLQNNPTPHLCSCWKMGKRGKINKKQKRKKFGGELQANK